MLPTDMKMAQAVMRCLMDYMQTKISTEADRKNRAATEYHPAAMRNPIKALYLTPLLTAEQLAERGYWHMLVSVLIQVSEFNYHLSMSKHLYHCSNLATAKMFFWNIVGQCDDL